MAKTQNHNNTDQNATIFFISAAIIIVITFLLFTPKIAASLFPFKRQAVFNNFIKGVKKDAYINPQQFWEFREFYSPGYFTLSKDGLKQSDVKNTIQRMDVDIKQDAFTLPFAIFHSPKLSSVDALSNQRDLKAILASTNAENIIFQNNTSLIYRDGEKSVKVIFIKPGKEMRKAVGFYDYNGEDKKITEGKYWLDITSITLD